MTVSKDKVVYIHYTLKNDGGEVLDSSIDGEPLAYIHGNNHLIPGLEEVLEGKKAEDFLTVSVPPEKGYGEVTEGSISTHSVKNFDNSEELKIGMQVHSETEEGVVAFTVVKVDDKEVTLDANHPLAGQTLHFEVTVTEIREASAEELDHGHVH